MFVQDRRVKRTQQALLHALISLTLEKGYNAMTIRDITERAKVGYATFFRHYADKDALLHEVLTNVYAEMSQLLPLPSKTANTFALGVPLFRYVQQHEQVVRVLLSSGESSDLVNSVVKFSTEYAHTQCPPKELRDEGIPLEIMLFHVVNSTVALIKWWLDHDMPYTPEHMGTIYHKLIEEPHMLSTVGQS